MTNQASTIKQKDDALNKQLKESFPASDAAAVTQPKKEGSGAPADRKSVNSGREQELADEIALNKTPPEKL